MAHWKNASQTNDEISRLKRDAIIREAGRIFSRDGFHNVSLDEVARVLDVSKGTLYNYVRDKQEILFECHKLALSVAERAFEACSPGDSGAERLRTILTTYATAISEELGACGIINETGALREQDRRFVRVSRRKLNSRLVAIVEDGVRDGSLRRVDAKLAVFTVVGAVHAIPSWYSPNGRLSGAEVAEQIVDIAMRGLLPSPDEAAISPPRMIAERTKVAQDDARTFRGPDLRR
jgi:AcrR family transcriptional regulator